LPKPAESWATQQLVEFLAVVSAYVEAPAALLGGAERAASALDAEVAAVVADGRVAVSIGFPEGDAPADALIELVSARGGTLALPGVGDCEAAVAPLLDPSNGALVVARLADDPFNREELDVLRGMGRTLGLVLGNLRLVASLRERQSLLERLSRVQRSIAARTALGEVLEAIVTGAAELIGDEIGVLRLLPESDSARTEIAASVGLLPAELARIKLARVGDGASGLAIERDRLVVIEEYQRDNHASGAVAREGIEAALAAPVYERGQIAGSLVVGTRRPGRVYTEGEREVLLAFAEHAGLALNDARSVAETTHQAFHDSLTGLPNRSLFLDRLEHALARTSREGSAVAVLFCDLDGFKTVNDSLGHGAGDELLREVGERLSRGLRSGDTVARFGGDEFAILLERPDGEEGATRVADRLHALLVAPFRVRGREVFLTASIGVAVGRDEPGHLLRNADLAMYRAKAQGKGRSAVFEPAMHAAAVERMELQVDLKRASERREFVVHYQPIHRLDTRAIVGVEALVRWQHPERGLLYPNAFIPVAEEARQIIDLGGWVLREALRQAAVWQARYPRPEPLQIGVNMSGIELDQPDVVDRVSDALRSARIDPRAVVLEMTETALMADSDANAGKLDRLKGLGVLIAVDDFGTGYSSLEYLRRFPIDILKVARSFVAELTGTPEEVAIVRAMIELAETFQLRVVAEGIEHEVQRHELLELGCELGQGFLFSRPLEPAAVEPLLLRPAAESDTGRTATAA
jgi:diguanylate cyclase (GGDEF)-like protein